MRYSVLASGSTGNAIYIETEHVRFLIDAGLSARAIERLMAIHGLHPQQLDGIVVTHEHRDHIQGVGVLARRYRLPVWANPATWEQLPALIGEIPEELVRLFDTGVPFTMGDVELESFPLSHDAADPVGFCLYHGPNKLSLVTDTGYVSQRLLEKVRGSRAVIFEANHDIEMLRMGHYPWNVKRRILSDMGHLSNEAAGEALVELLKRARTEQVYLAHLSQENNQPDLALLTVQSLMQEAGVEVGKEVQLHLTYPDRPTPLASLHRPQRG